VRPNHQRQFANVFYKQNIAVGATRQSFYMDLRRVVVVPLGLGGMPGELHVVRLRAAIRENGSSIRSSEVNRTADRALHEAVAPLTKTDRNPARHPGNPAIVDTAREEPGTPAPESSVGQSNSTFNVADSTHLSTT